MKLWIACVSALAASTVALVVSAEVTEPNGTRVPTAMSTNPAETSLQAYFDGRNEGIDAAAEASENPGVFSPLCNFTATLVLSESNAAAGLAWYNVPVDPSERPTVLHPIVEEIANATGAVVNAADIRASADYAGGHIGFALTKFGGTAVYYSEYRRNAECTACSTPGHWKMMLAYPSKVHASSYYIAFEDWEGANHETWFGNDGDFNDKVFFVTGVSCPGGGEPCETGKPGLCAAGLTECAFMGTPQCKQQYTEKPETCDNVDNDCNGRVDDGDLCGSGEVCVRGKCVGACSAGEFRCPTSFVCGDDGFCIERACAEVVCGAGLVCRGGECVGECQGVVCPLGQICQGDRCIDPCAGVTCAAGTFCERGVCVGDCTCSGCPSGKACAANGACVAAGCEGVSCGAGQGCRDGVVRRSLRRRCLPWFRRMRERRLRSSDPGERRQWLGRRFRGRRRDRRDAGRRLAGSGRRDRGWRDRRRQRRRTQRPGRTRARRTQLGLRLSRSRLLEQHTARRSGASGARDVLRSPSAAIGARR